MCQAPTPVTCGVRLALDEGVVEVAELAVEEVGVGVGAEEGGLEVGVAAGRDASSIGVSCGVGVEVAEQQHVRIAGRRQHGAVDPGEEAVGLRERAWR